MGDLSRLLAQFEPEGLGPEGPGWQQRKSAHMRTAILEAAIVCLASHGYAGATTQIIAETARVSRGAMLHHYPTKAALIEAIVDFCFYRRIQMLGAGLNGLSETERVEGYAGLEVLWSTYITPEHRAYRELSVAARTDRELHACFAPQAVRFQRLWLAEVGDFFPEWADDPERLARTTDLSAAVLEGLSLYRDIWDSPQRVERLRTFLRQLVAGIHIGQLGFAGPAARAAKGAAGT